jgi:hypothetical protein
VEVSGKRPFCLTVKQAFPGGFQHVLELTLRLVTNRKMTGQIGTSRDAYACMGFERKNAPDCSGAISYVKINLLLLGRRLTGFHRLVVGTLGRHVHLLRMGTVCRHVHLVVMLRRVMRHLPRCGRLASRGIVLRYRQ